MNVRTLRKTLDNYGFDTEKVVDSLLDVYIKQHVSDRGVLTQDVPRVAGVLCSYHLVEKDSWGSVNLYTCTQKGERIAQALIQERVESVFEEFRKLNLEGSYLILKYLIHLINQGKNVHPLQPEFRLLSSLPVIEDLVSVMKSVMREHGLLRSCHQFTSSGPAGAVEVTLFDMYEYFEQYYTGEERIVSFEQILESVSKKLNFFRLLYFYEDRTERVYMRKIREYNVPLEDISSILDIMKQRNLIRYTRKPVFFKIEDKRLYRQFLKENILSPVLNEFSHQMKQTIRSNPQAYKILADFEEQFRDFLEKTLKKAEEDWEKRIPDDILNRLKERQNDARIRKKTVYPLLHYTDFHNYLSIVLYRTESFNNWELFEPYFVSIGWIKGRLIEMNEIRNDLAHPKPLEPLQYRKLQLYIDEIEERIIE